jgi:hypothetical protein
VAEHESAADETGADEAGDWYDDAPITDEQIEAVRTGLGTEGRVYYQFSRAVVRKLLAEIDRLNVVLDANRVVRNAAESSSRTYKGAMELLKTQRTQLRNELAAANERAEKAEVEVGRLVNLNRDLARSTMRHMEKIGNERDEARARLAGLGEAETEQRIIGVSGVAHYAPTEWDLAHRHEWLPGVRLEEREVHPTPWRPAADATGTALSATETEDNGPPVSVDAANSSANAAGPSQPCHATKWESGFHHHCAEVGSHAHHQCSNGGNCSYGWRNDETGTER